MTIQLIGITGTIGSGKSLAGSFLKELGATVIEADDHAREAVAPESTALKQIKEAFGDQYLLPNGSLNRRLLGETVFSNPEKLAQLEAIVHPQVKNLLAQKLKEVAANTSINDKTVFYLVPLLFEKKLFSKGPLAPPLDQLAHYHHSVTISCSMETALKRLKQRDQLNDEEARSRYRSQMSNSEKCQLADIIIDNSGTKEQLKSRITEYYRSIG